MGCVQQKKEITLIPINSSNNRNIIITKKLADQLKTSTSNSNIIKSPEERRKEYQSIKITTKNFILEKTNKVEVNYRILSIIGKGSYGSVYKVQHKSSGIFRAMKIIKKSNIELQDDEQKFLKEIEILMKIDHPNIIKIYEYYTDEINYLIITEFIGGGDLYTAINKFSRFSEEIVALIMYQLLSAISYLHSLNIVHRDIKPENILVETWSLKNNDISIKVIDFGTSNYFTTKNKLSLKIGSPYYIAPEVLADSYNEKCDVWSCGVLMYILITGKPPFFGKSVTEIMACVSKANMDKITPLLEKVSPPAKKLILQLLTKDYNKRISAEEALNSEWITNFKEKENKKIKTEDCIEVLQNIKNFSAQERLQHATIAYIVHFIGANDEVKKLKKIFKALDSSGDGRLTYNELRNGFEKIIGTTITDVEMEKIALDIDQDRNGFIEYEEFLRVALNKNTLLSKENLKLAFDNFDVNGDGSLSAEEIKTILGTNNNEYFDDILQKIDENGDGEISFNEFSILMNEILTKNIVSIKTDIETSQKDTTIEKKETIEYKETIENKVWSVDIKK